MIDEFFEFLFEVILQPVFNIFDKDKLYIILKKYKTDLIAVSHDESYPITIIIIIIMCFTTVFPYVPALILLVYYKLFKEAFLMFAWGILATILVGGTMKLIMVLGPEYRNLVSDTIFYYIPGTNPVTLGMIMLLIALIGNAILPFYILNNLSTWRIAKLIKDGYEIKDKIGSVNNYQEALLEYSSRSTETTNSDSHLSIEDDNMKSTKKKKNLFLNVFIFVFVFSVLLPLINGRGADTLLEGLTIYLFSPLIVAVVIGLFISAIYKIIR